MNSFVVGSKGSKHLHYLRYRLRALCKGDRRHIYHLFPALSQVAARPASSLLHPTELLVQDDEEDDGGTATAAAGVGLRLHPATPRLQGRAAGREARGV